MKKRATVYWTVEDILRLKPGWSRQQCAEFLDQEEEEIKEVMIEKGWSYILSTLNDYDDN